MNFNLSFSFMYPIVHYKPYVFWICDGHNGSFTLQSAIKGNKMTLRVRWLFFGFGFILQKRK